MEGSLLILIPISVVLVLLIVGVLWWAARSGQFDDMEGPAHAILMDDDSPRPHAISHKAASESAPTASPDDDAKCGGVSH
jgi:cbb3-type cytochrome oxidase maturation protein